nr:FAD-binding protein [uncultured Schaedlerella sp.]
MKTEADVVIVGTGVAGLFSALNLPGDTKIIMITKSDLESSDSFLAQGGISVLRDEEDYDSYFEDTMRAGHYENRKESVDIMIRGSRDVIDKLVVFGVEFEHEQEAEGEFLYTREGAHSKPRILYHKDITGKEITSKLLEQVKRLENVTLYEYTAMTDILVENGACVGILAERVKNDRQGETDSEAADLKECHEEAGILQGEDACRERDKAEAPGETACREQMEIRAGYTIFATGGIGGQYTHSTNFPHLTGDAIEISKKHGIRLEHLDYVQFHPTTLYSKKPGRRFLISESVRGEGAVLYNKKKERFVDELLPRDVVAAAIREQMEKDGTDFVYLSMEHIEKETILRHFPNIYQRCLEEGYDVLKECIPVVPAQHYFMGGVWVDSDSRTSMPRLFAVGETSCNGVHGANRLASNSLLESLVFAKRAAMKIREEIEGCAEG